MRKKQVLEEAYQKARKKNLRAKKRLIHGKQLSDEEITAQAEALAQAERNQAQVEWELEYEQKRFRNLDNPDHDGFRVSDRVHELGENLIAASRRADEARARYLPDKKQVARTEKLLRKLDATDEARAAASERASAEKAYRDTKRELRQARRQRLRDSLDKSEAFEKTSSARIEKLKEQLRIDELAKRDAYFNYRVEKRLRGSSNSPEIRKTAADLVAAEEGKQLSASGKITDARRLAYAGQVKVSY